MNNEGFGVEDYPYFELSRYEIEKHKISYTIDTLINLKKRYDEIELIGFPVTVNAFDRLQTSFRGEIMARQMDDNLGKQVRMLGRLVTIKYVKTVKNEQFTFTIFLTTKKLLKKQKLTEFLTQPESQR